MKSKKIIALLTALCVAVSGAAIYFALNKNGPEEEAPPTLHIDMDAWRLDKKHGVYYQLGVPYCLTPESPEYETLALYVPAEYFVSEKKESGLYTCRISPHGARSGYSASNAPVIFPVDVTGYESQKPHSEYDFNAVKAYIGEGFVCVYAGLRGVDAEKDGVTFSAPSAAVDLKAAIRYYRYNKAMLPGDSAAIFTFGSVYGGTLSAVIGASGDSQPYYNYLRSLGAAMRRDDESWVTDEIAGVYCISPVLNPDEANAAYEWNSGQFFNDSSRSDGHFTSLLSKDLARAYADYVNLMGFKDEDGKRLKLEECNSGVYLKGGYYDYLLKESERSLERYLDGRSKKETARYIKTLNSDDEWVTYSKKDGVEIKSLEAFAKAVFPVQREVASFDPFDRSSAENTFYGDGKTPLHFDLEIEKLLKDNVKNYSAFEDFNRDYYKEYEADLLLKDTSGTAMRTRTGITNPVYYLSPYYRGNGSSKPAKYWCITRSISDASTAPATALNLKLCLMKNRRVRNLQYRLDWGEEEYKTDSSRAEFIKWVKERSADIAKDKLWLIENSAGMKTDSDEEISE